MLPTCYCCVRHLFTFFSRIFVLFARSNVNVTTKPNVFQAYKHSSRMCHFSNFFFTLHLTYNFPSVFFSENHEKKISFPFTYSENRKQMAKKTFHSNPNEIFRLFKLVLKLWHREYNIYKNGAILINSQFFHILCFSPYFLLFCSRDVCALYTMCIHYTLLILKFTYPITKILNSLRFLLEKMKQKKMGFCGVAKHIKWKYIRVILWIVSHIFLMWLCIYLTYWFYFVILVFYATLCC